MKIFNYISVSVYVLLAIFLVLISAYYSASFNELFSIFLFLGLAILFLSLFKTYVMVVGLLILSFIQYYISLFITNPLIDNVDAILIVLLVISLKITEIRKGRDYSSHQNPIFKKYELFLIIFSLFLVISAFINEVPIAPASLGMFQLLKSFLLFYIGLYLSFSYKLNEQTVVKVTKFILFLLFIIAVLGILQFILGSNFSTTLHLVEVFRFGAVRATSIFEHPIVFGLVMVMTLLVAVGLYVYNKSSKRVIVYVSVFLFAVIASSTRQALLSFAFAIFILLLFEKKFKVLFGFLIGIVLLIVLFPEATINQFTDGLDFVEQVGDYYRYDAFLLSLNVLKDHLLIGVGPGRFGGYISYLYMSPIYEEYNFSFGRYKTLDMFWPHMWGELGIIGSFLFLFLLWFTISKTYVSRLNFQTNYLKGVTWGVTASLVSLFVSGFFNPVMEMSNIVIPLFLTSGILVGMSAKIEQTTAAKGNIKLEKDSDG